MAERVALYPGSFDPPTYGHLDLIERACAFFDRVIVGVADNSGKNYLFTPEERQEMLEHITSHVSNMEIVVFKGLTAEYARVRGAVALVRGLRLVSDFEFELTMAVANKKLNPGIDTVCLMPSERYLLLSSRIVREVARHGGDLTEFVPPEVARRLQEKMAARATPG